MGDRMMMEEVLELLASDSPDHASAVSTTVSSSSGSNHTSNVTDLNHGSSSGTNDGDNGDKPGRPDDNLEEKYPADYRAVQFQGADTPLQQNPISDFCTAVARRAAPPALQTPWTPPLLSQFSPVKAPPPAQLSMPAPAITSVPAPLPVSRGLQTPRTHTKQPKPTQPSTTSNVLPTGQEVKVMNSAEFDELRRKLRMQTASRRYRRRKKDESRQQKIKILELQAELKRLQDLETQMKQYQQRPIASLKEELQMYQDNISDLSQKVQKAASEEMDWTNLMGSNLRK